MDWLYVDGEGPDLNPQIIQDCSGTLHVVWESDKFLSDFSQHSDIFQTTNGGSGWSNPTMVNQPNASADRNPQIIEDSGTLYAVWSASSGAGTDFDIFRATNSGSGWSVPELVNTNGTTDSGSDSNPQIVKDSSGTLHVVWHGFGDTGPSGTDFDVFYALNNGSGWSAQSLLNINGTADTLYDGFAQIIVGSSGTLHAVWHSNEDLNGEAGADDYDIFYAYNSGGGIANYSNSTPTLTNCILWGDSAPSGPEIYNDRTSSATVSYCDVQGGYDGTGNIDDDPLFIDPNGLDRIPGTADDQEGCVHLRGYSPCINAGDPAGSYRGQVDLDNQPRVAYGRVDMGADEVFPVAGDSEPDGDVDLADFVAIFVLNWLLGAD